MSVPRGETEERIRQTSASLDRARRDRTTSLEQAEAHTSNAKRLEHYIGRLEIELRDLAREYAK